MGADIIKFYFTLLKIFFNTVLYQFDLFMKHNQPN